MSLRAPHVRPLTSAVWLGAAAAFAPSALAGDHTNLDEHLPVTFTDARPIGYLAGESQGMFRFQRESTGENVLHAVPRLEFGFPRNAQISVSVPGKWKLSHERPELGRIAGEVFYNLNQQTLTLPMVAIAAAVEAPTEKNTAGWDPEARLFLTKNIPGSSYYHAIHLNGAYQWNVARLAEERAGRYRFSVGYSFRLATSLLGLAGFTREQRMLYRWHENHAEVGVRFQVNHLLVLSFGGSVGIGEQSPLMRFVFGIQHRSF